MNRSTIPVAIATLAIPMILATAASAQTVPADAKAPGPKTIAIQPGVRSPRVPLPPGVKEREVREQIQNMDDDQLLRLLDRGRRARHNRDLLERLRKRYKPEILGRLEETYRLEPMPLLPRAEVHRPENIDELIDEVEWELVRRSIELPGGELKIVYEEPPELQDIQRGHVPASEDEVIEVAKSVVAIIERGALKGVDEDDDGVIDKWQLTTTAMQTVKSGSFYLCDFGGFYGMPATSVRGTGFLVGDDLIATAGHIVLSETFLADVYFVFGYVHTDAETARTEYELKQVYEGESREYYRADSEDNDFALIKLTAKPTDEGYEALELAKDELEGSESLYMIGHPLGLAQMYAGIDPVADNGHCRHFESPLDSYPGNSGSPVFNSDTHEVEGILVSKEDDFQKFCNCYSYLDDDDDSVPARVSRIRPVQAYLTNEGTIFVNNKSGSVVKLRTDDDYILGLDVADEPISWSQTMVLVHPGTPSEDEEDASVINWTGGCELTYVPLHGEVWNILSVPGADTMIMRTCDDEFVAEPE